MKKNKMNTKVTNNKIINLIKNVKNINNTIENNVNQSIAIAQVFSTNNYNLFKIFNYNRKINVTKNSKQLTSVQQFGILVPIVVDENFFVLDGQHRLECARKTNQPVPYIIMPSGTKSHLAMIQMNAHQKNWSPDNYLSSYCALGEKDYIDFRFWKNKFSVSTTSLFMLFAHQSLMGLHLDSFRDGNFKFTKTQISLLNDLFKDYEPFLVDKKMKSALTKTRTLMGVVKFFQDPRSTKLKKNKLLKELQNNVTSISRIASFDKAEDVFREISKIVKL